MGRKSRAKAAHREARAREAVAGVGAAAPIMPSMDATARAPIGRLWSTAPPGAARMAALVGGVEPCVRSRRNRPSGDCSRLRMLVQEQIAAQRAVEDEIRVLLDRGHSWTEIGDALGLSRQGVRQRYRRLHCVDNHAQRSAPSNVFPHGPGPGCGLANHVGQRSRPGRNRVASVGKASR